MNKLKMKRILLAICALVGFGSLKASLKALTRAERKAVKLSAKKAPVAKTAPSLTAAQIARSEPPTNVGQQPVVATNKGSGNTIYENFYQQADQDYETEAEPQKEQPDTDQGYATEEDPYEEQPWDDEEQPVQQSSGKLTEADLYKALAEVQEAEMQSEQEAAAAVTAGQGDVKVQNKLRLLQWQDHIDRELQDNPQALAHELLAGLGDYGKKDPVEAEFKAKLEAYIHHKKGSENVFRQAVNNFVPTNQMDASIVDRELFKQWTDHIDTELQTNPNLTAQDLLGTLNTGNSDPKFVAQLTKYINYQKAPIKSTVGGHAVNALNSKEETWSGLFKSFIKDLAKDPKIQEQAVNAIGTGANHMYQHGGQYAYRVGSAAYNALTPRQKKQVLQQQIQQEQIEQQQHPQHQEMVPFNPEPFPVAPAYGDENLYDHIPEYGGDAYGEQEPLYDTPEHVEDSIYQNVG
ncbi:MAG: hypothetical protein ACJAZS_000315 [Alteromonas naphthalenivorans]|jgi:hypothetical protein